MNKSHLSGILPAVPTPFTEEGELDLASLRSNLAKMMEMPLSGYVIGGSSGEFVFLNEEERIKVVAAARDEISSDRALIVGTGMESTRETIALTAKMADLGADAAIVVTPSYFTRMMTSEALTVHYLSVADSSPIPILLYSVPVFTGFDLPEETVVKASQHPKIIGMKDSGRDVIRIASMIRGSPDDFSMLVGSAALFLAGLSVGCVGTISALANVASQELDQIQREFKDGNLELARAIQGRMIEPNRALTVRFGVPGLKYALDLVGYRGGYPRAPLLPLKMEDKGEIEVVLKKSGLLQ